MAAGWTRPHFSVSLRRLQDVSAGRACGRRTCPRSTGAAGWGPGRARAANEVIGSSIWWGPIVFGNQAPDAGNAELLALFGTEEQKRRWLEPLWRRDPLGVLDDRSLTSGSDPTLLATTARLDGDEWVIDGREVVHDQRHRRRPADRDGGHRSRRRAAPACVVFLVPADTPGVSGFVTSRPRAAGAVRATGTRRSATTGSASGRMRCSASAGRIRDGPGPARPRPHPPLHALARPVAARVRHPLRAVVSSAHAFGGPLAARQTGRTGSRIPLPRCTRRG